MKFLYVFPALILALAFCTFACLGGGFSPQPVEGPSLQDPTAAPADPAKPVADSIEALASAWNEVSSDGIVTEEESARFRESFAALGPAVASSWRIIETRFQAQLTQIREQGGGVDWLATAINIGLGGLFGGGLGFQLVRKVPNRMILGTEPDPEVARVATLKP